MLLTGVLLTLSFFVGYAIRRGSVCAVLATRTLIVDRRAARFRAFGVAAAGSGAVIIPLHWLLPDSVTLSAGYPVTIQILLAGAAFGIGARINGACGLGTLAHLTGGNLNYAGTIVGMAAGASLIASIEVETNVVAPLISPLETPDAGSILFAVILILILVSALYRRVPRWVRNLREPASARMGPYRAMLVVGVCGGLLYALAGNWTYMSVISERAALLVGADHVASGWPVLLCAATVAAGGVAAALQYGPFDLRRPRLLTSLRCVSGGRSWGPRLPSYRGERHIVDPRPPVLGATRPSGLCRDDGGFVSFVWDQAVTEGIFPIAAIRTACNGMRLSVGYETERTKMNKFRRLRKLGARKNASTKQIPSI